MVAGLVCLLFQYLVGVSLGHVSEGTLICGEEAHANGECADRPTATIVIGSAGQRGGVARA